MANQNTRQAHKKGFSSMADMLNNGHKTVSGVCVHSNLRDRNQKHRYPGSKKGY